MPPVLALLNLDDEELERLGPEQVDDSSTSDSA